MPEPRPPRLTRFLLRLLPAELRAFVRADLDEEFHHVVGQRGLRTARWWYRRLALRSLWDAWLGASGVLRLCEEGGGTMLNDWTEDFRHGLRLLKREPLVSLAMIGTMVLAIGAISAVSSLAYGVLVRPLPFPDSERIVHISRTTGRTPPPFRAVGLPDLHAWRAESATMLEIAGWTAAGAAMMLDGTPERVVLAEVTEGFERVLGVSPEAGRFFDASEFAPGASYVLVVSHAFWRSRLGGDRRAVGRTLVLDGIGHEIVGVLPPMSLEYPNVGFDAWRPLARPNDHWSLTVRGASWLNAVGRVRAGTSLEAAQLEMESLQARLARAFPRQQENQTSVLLEPLRNVIAAPARQALILLSVAVAAILVIACTNLAVILLALATRRVSEFAIRSALGGSSGRIRRQLIAEAFVVAGIGGALGVLMAPTTLSAVIALYPDGLPRGEELGLDLALVGVASLCVLVTAVVAGTAPGLWAARQDIRARLATRTTTSGGRMRETLVASQVGLSVVLLVGSALLLQTLRNLAAVDPGFDGMGVTTFRVAPAAAAHPDGRSLDVFYSQLVAELSGSPAVERAGFANFAPLTSGEWGHTFTVVGSGALNQESDGHPANVRITSSEYYATLSVPLTHGRLFDSRDRRDGAHVAILNRAAAVEAFSGADPIGRFVDFEGETREIIGIVGDVRHHALSEEPTPEIHLPATQMELRSAWVVVAEADGRRVTAADIRGALRRTDPTVAPVGLVRYEERFRTTLAQERFRAMLVTSLGLIAVAIALLGIYGAVANMVTRRLREIGIRMTLGEGRFSVVRRVLVRAGTVSGIGVGIGLVTAAALSNRIADLLFGVGSGDMGTYLAVSALVWAVSLLAALGPAARASRLDPVEVMRAD